MRRALSPVVLSGLVLSLLVPPALATDTRTVTGEVVEMNCYARSGASGPGHAACALKCARGGSSNLAILTEDAVLSISGDLADFPELLGLIARRVEATGDVMEKDGKLWINIQSLTPAE